MSFFRETGAMICVCCVICGALGILAPLGNTRKLMNVVMGIFFLAAAVSSFSEAEVNFQGGSFDIPESEELTLEYEGYGTKEVLRVAQEKLEEYAAYILEQEGIEPEDISVILEMDQSGGIYVESINIYINQEQNRLFKTKISSTIKNEFKVFPNIVNVDESGEDETKTEAET